MTSTTGRWDFSEIFMAESWNGTTEGKSPGGNEINTWPSTGTGYMLESTVTKSVTSSPAAMAPTDAVSSMIDHVVYGWLIPLLAAVGIPGSVLSLIVLSVDPWPSLPAAWYLRGLAVSDIGTLFCLFPHCLIRHSLTNTPAVQLAFREIWPYRFWLGNAFLAASSWITMGFAVERLMVVAFPLKAKSICTKARARGITIGVYLFNFLFMMPRMFEFEQKPVLIKGLPENTTSWAFGGLASNAIYARVYYNIYFVVTLTPVVIVAVSNVVLLVLIRRQGRLRKSMTSSSESQDQSSVTQLVVAVVSVFTICNFPDSLSHLIDAIPEAHRFISERAPYIYNLSNAFHFNNAAWNFFLYIGTSRQFRNTIRQMLRRFRKGRNLPPKTQTTS